MDTKTSPGRWPGAYVGAALLIVIGAVALTANLGGNANVYESIPFAIGIAFLVAYALTRQYGYMVPAGILTGLGAGLLTSSLLNVSNAGPYIVIGLGVGFLAIFVVDLIASRGAFRWWPVIPGGLLLVVGSAIATESNDVLRVLQVWSPAVLIALGVLIMVTRIRRTT